MSLCFLREADHHNIMEIPKEHTALCTGTDRKILWEGSCRWSTLGSNVPFFPLSKCIAKRTVSGCDLNPNKPAPWWWWYVWESQEVYLFDTEACYLGGGRGREAKEKTKRLPCHCNEWRFRCPWHFWTEQTFQTLFGRSWLPIQKWVPPHTWKPNRKLILQVP